jgi:serine/threonine protein kinase
MPPEAKAPTNHQLGDYEVLSKIAEGGMGAVFRARHINTGELVAIKVLPPATAKNPVLLKRFEQEFRAAAALDHPNIVRAIEYCGAVESPFLVMEYVDGESLGSLIDRHGPFREEDAIRIITQVCQGLHRAHKQKLIHRDVKPDNVILRSDGVAKLTDLGLVKDEDNETNLTKTGRGLGTPNYMAPEQFRNAKHVDVRSDIYSLGATLYSMLTGDIPFGKVGPLDCWMRKVRNEITPPREINPSLSERVDWAVRRAMSGDPEKRPSSCKEFVEDLTGVSIQNGGSDHGEHPLPDLWYLVYKDDEGETHTVKGSADGIRRALREGLLGDASNVRASRTKQGQFLPLHSFPEFRDLVIEPAPLATPNPAVSSASAQALRPTASMLRSRTVLANTRPKTDPEAVDYITKTQPIRPGYDPFTDDRPVSEETTARPHFQVAAHAASSDPFEKSRSVEWIWWFGILVLAVLTGFVAIKFLPMLGV